MLGLTVEQIELLKTLFNEKNKERNIVPEGLAELIITSENINAVDPQGYTALHHAIRKGDVEFVKDLMALDASFLLVEGTSLPMFALERIAFSSSKDAATQILEILLKKKDLDLSKEPLLFSAIEYLLPPNVFKLLLEQKTIDIKQKNILRKTILMEAISYHSKIDIIKMILEKDTSNINDTDLFENTALTYAIDNGDPELLKVILSVDKIDINKRSLVGNTPLMHAINSKANPKIILLLLAQPGIDVNQENHRGETALATAIKMEADPEIISAIKQLTTSPNPTITVSSSFSKKIEPTIEDLSMYAPPTPTFVIKKVEPVLDEDLFPTTVQQQDLSSYAPPTSTFVIKKVEPIFEEDLFSTPVQQQDLSAYAPPTSTFVIKKVEPILDEDLFSTMEVQYQDDSIFSPSNLPFAVKKVEPTFAEINLNPPESAPSVATISIDDTLLSLKLFSHINNDAHLIGTRTLEGENFQHTVKFLSHFISQIRQGKTSFPIDLLADSQIENLEKKLNDMLKLDNEISKLTDKLKNLSEEERKQAYLTFTEESTQKIMDIPAGENEKGIFFPGGWNGKPHGHAMVYEFRKDKEGNLIFLIYNSGSGLNNHIRIPSPDKERFLPVKAYKIPKNSATVDNLKFFLAELVKPQVESLLPDSNVRRNRRYNSERLYHQVIATITYLDAEEVDPREIDPSLKEIMTMGQRSGTCAEKVLHELIKTAMPNPRTAKIFLFSLKKYSIEKFTEQNIKDPIAIEQIHLAIENLARIIEKDPSLLSEDVIDQTFKLIQKITTTLKKSENTDPLSQNLDTMWLSKVETLETSSQGNVSPLLEPTLLPHDTHSKPKEEISPPAFYSAESIQEFFQKIAQLKEAGHHEVLCSSVERFLLELPLDAKNYTALDNVEKSSKFVNALSQILVIYGQSSQHVDTEQSFGPKRVIAMLNAKSVLRLITHNNLLDQEGNPILNWNYEYQSMLSRAKTNPFLSTTDPLLDQKFTEIRASEQKLSHRYEEEFAFYTKLIEKHPNSKQLKEFLEKKFSEKAKTKFKEEEISCIHEKKLAAEVCLAALLSKEDLTPDANYADILEKARLRQSTEKICTQIDACLSSFSYEKLEEIATYPSVTIEVDTKRREVSFEKRLLSRAHLASKLTSWSGDINDQTVKAALQSDFGDEAHINKLLGKEYDFQVKYDKDKKFLSHPNYIFSLENGPEEVSPQKSPQKTTEQSTVKSHVKKMLWLLRAEPDLQILTTLDFFDGNMELLNQFDYQYYFKKNIFQPGLLAENLEKNPQFYERMNEFIEQGITNFSQDNKLSNGSVFFYKLKYDFHQYILKSKFDIHHSSSKKALEGLQSELEEAIQTDIPKVNLTLYTTYLNTSVLLINSQENVEEETLYKIFERYLSYKNVIKESSNLTPEQRNEQMQLNKMLYALFNKHQEKIPLYISQCYQNLYPDIILPSPLLWESNYPRFIAKNNNSELIVSFDLTTAELWTKGEHITKVPQTLSAHPLYKMIYPKSDSTVAITPILYPEQKQSVRRIRMIDDPNNGVFLETPHLKHPFAYHCQKSINGKKDIYELQTLSDKNSQPSTSLLGTPGANLALPKSFFCASTRYWQNKSGEGIVEREGKKYFITSDKITHELDEKYNQTGYTLLNSRETKDFMADFSVGKIYEMFSNFEDPLMIEILVNKSINNGPQLKILFPRYNLELHGFKNEKGEWSFSPAHDSQLILKSDQSNPLSDFKAPLIFEHVITKEKIAYIPFQEFYVKKKESWEIEPEYKTAYYNFTFDTTLQVKEHLLEKVNKSNSDKGSANQTWHYTGDESYIAISIDKEKSQFKAKDPSEALYLAYLHLCQHQPERALNYLSQIVTNGGIKGTQKEIEIIEKIINGVPRFPNDAKIENPKNLAVKMHALSLITHHLAKGKEINLSTKQTNLSSRSEFYIENYNKQIQLFSTNLDKNIKKQFHTYHHTRNNIPSYMKLSENQELEMLNFTQRNQQLDGPLAVRFKELKSKQLGKELAFIKSQNPIPATLKKRQKQIEEKLQKTKKVVQITSTIASSNFVVDTPELFKNNSEEIRSDYTIYENIYQTNTIATLPKPGMSDQEFLRNFLHYYRIAKAAETTNEKQLLKRFCEQTILANKKLNDKKQTTIIPDFSGVLLKIISFPEAFSSISIPDKSFETSSFVDKIFSTAHSLEISLATHQIENKPESTSYQASPALQALPIVEKMQAKEFSYKELDNLEFINQTDLAAFIEECKKETETLNNEIKYLIQERYPIDTSFEKNASTIAALDNEIGKLRNAFNLKIQQLTIKHLHSSQTREKILKQSEKFETLTSKKLPELEKDILTLANTGPDNAIERRMFDIQHFGQTRNKLEMKDIYRLYVLADKNEYKKATGLSDEEILKLHQKISDFIQLSILAQSYKRKQKALIKCQNLESSSSAYDIAYAELGACLSEENHANFSSQPEIQFFQMEQGFLVYPLSIKYLDKLLQADTTSLQFKNEIIQLAMGGGKSKVLSPLLAIKKANGTNLVVHQVKSSLFNTSYSDLNSTSLKLFGQEAIPFQFDRNSPCDSSALKEIYHKLHQTMVSKKYLVTTGESLQSLELKYLELLLLGPKKYENEKDSELAFKEWSRQIKWLDKSLIMIKEHGDRLIDEIHDDLHHKKLLNYNLGAPVSLAKEDINLEISLAKFFDNVHIEDILHINHEVTLRDVIEKKNVYFVNDEKWDDILSRLAEMLVKNTSSPIADIVKKLQLNEDKKLLLVKYLLSKSNQICENFSELSPEEINDIEFLKEQISDILPFTLPKKLHEHYGASKKSSTIYEKMLPIPYKSNNTANERAKFGHPFEHMNYAIMMCLQAPIPDEMIREIIKGFINQAKAERLESPGLSFNKTLANIKFCSLFENESIGLEALAKKDSEDYQTAIVALRNSNNFINYCLKEIILPQIKIHPLMLSSDSQNSAAMTRTNQGQTGTPWNYRAMHQDFTFDPKDNLGTDGEIIDTLKNKKTAVESAQNFSSPQDLLEEMMPRLKEKGENLRAIIDVGSLFRGMSNETVANEIANYYTSLTTNLTASKAPSIKYVLYYDNDEEVLYALNAKTKEKIKLDTTDENKINKILRCPPNERFTYYDQARCTGTDILQAENAHALVTFNEKTVKFSFLQGAKRMRQITKGQSVTIVGPSYLKPLILENDKALDNVLTLFEHNQQQEALQAHMRSTFQKFKNVVRENLLQKIYATKDPLEKARLLKAFEKYFAFRYNANRFLNAGTILTNEDTAQYIKNLEIYFSNDWQKLISQANITSSEEDVSIIKQSLHKVTVQGIESCPTVSLQKTKPPSLPKEKLEQPFALGNEVELQTNLETEIENELENETQQELDLEQVRLFYEEKVNPNLEKDFDLSLGTIDQKDYLLSLNETLKSNGVSPSFSFSSHIHITPQFAKTHDRQTDFLCAYTKPIEVVMMVASKSSPEKFDAIVMTKKEAARFAKMSDEELNDKFPEHKIWMVTPRGTLIYGMPPERKSELYYSTLEQIRYINGDCRLLSQQKEPLVWMNTHSDEKMKYLIQNILPVHPHQGIHYKSLAVRVDVMSKVIRYIVEHPTDDYSKVNLEKLHKGFNKLSEGKKKTIESLIVAYHFINSEYQSKQADAFFMDEQKFNEWIKSFPDEIKHLITLRRNILAFQLKTIQAIHKNEPLVDVIGGFPANIIDFNFESVTGESPLQLVIAANQMINLDYIINNNVLFNNLDPKGKSGLDYLLESAENNLDFSTEALHKAILKNPHTFSNEDYKKMIDFCVKRNTPMLLNSILNLYLITDHDLQDLIPLLTDAKHFSENNLQIKEMLSSLSLESRKLKHILCDQLKDIVKEGKPFPPLDKEPYSMLTLDEINSYGKNPKSTLLSYTSFIENPIPIHYHNVTDIAKQLLAKGMDINAIDPNGNTLLMFAVKNKNINLVKYLLDLGANVNLKVNEKTPLMEAAQNGYDGIVSLLLDHDADDTLSDQNGKTALMLAKEHNHKNVIGKLTFDIDELESQFRKAARMGNLPRVIKLHKKKINIDAETWGKTALMFAAENGHTTVVSFLLFHGANVNALDQEGNTALGLAIRDGHTDVANHILSQDINVDVNLGKNMTPLMWAALHGNAPMVKILLEKGAKINEVHAKSGQTALIMAIKGGQKDVITLLLNKGEEKIDLLVADQQSESALSYAKSSPEISELLSSHMKKFNINPKEEVESRKSLVFSTPVTAKTLTTEVNTLTPKANTSTTEKPKMEIEESKTVSADNNSTELSPTQIELNRKLLKAVREQKHELVEQLLQEHADPNATNILGTSALLFAAEINDLISTKLLIAHKANPNLAEPSNQTPLCVAARENFNELALELIKNGALVHDPSLLRDGQYRTMTPLMWAVTNGNKLLVAEFLKLNPDLNSKHEKSGQSPLLMAILGDHVDIVALLLEKGGKDIDMTVIDKTSNSILKAAQNKPEILKLINSHLEKYPVTNINNVTSDTSSLKA